MSKFILVVLVSLLSFNAVQAKDGKYHIAFMVTNPLGAYTKIGGGLEIRVKASAFVINAVNYSGIYAGKQYRFEYHKYMHTYRHRNEPMWYVKACGGDATYDGGKLSLLNDKSGLTVGPTTYIGGGAGFGYRVNGKHFFMLMNFGAKYVFLPPDFADEKREKFRLFYATGPGSVLDCNFRFGYQF